MLASYQYRSTLAGIVPWKATWQQFRLDISVVQDQFQTAVAPVIYEVGWAALAGLAMVLVIVMADAFAFRAEARGEALVPGGVLFVFIAALGSPRLRVGSTVLLIGAGVVAVVALRALHDRSRRVELSTSRRPSWALPASVAAAAVIALLAGWVGPRLPGADAEPLYETRGRGGGITEVLSPLVDIRSRLVNQGNVELFRVNADAEAYWRVTTLPEFDGRTFRLPKRKLTEIDGDDAVSTGGREIRQQYQILSLGGRLLPAAADPTAVLPNDEIRLNADTSTLVKTADLEPEELFTVVSRTPDITPELLNSATTSNPPDEVFLGLPDDFPDNVGELAAEVTAGATTDYDADARPAELVPDLHVQHRGAGRPRHQRDRELPRDPHRLLRAVLGDVRGDGPHARHPVAGRGRLHHRPAAQRRLVQRARQELARLARDLVRRHRVGGVRADAQPRHPGRHELHRARTQQDTTGVDPGGAVSDRPAPATPTTVFRPPTTNAPLDPATRMPTRTLRPERRSRCRRSTRARRRGGRSCSCCSSWSRASLRPPSAAGGREPAGGTRRPSASLRRGAGRAATCNRAGVDGSPSMTTHEWAAATAHQLPVAARPMASLAELVDRIEYSRPGTFDVDDTTNGSLGNDCELWASQIGRIAVDTLPATRKATRYFTEWN